MKRMENYELKPCPFCGSDDLFVFWRSWDSTPNNPDNYEYGVECIFCGIEIGIKTAYKTEQQAVAAWNNRV